MSNYIKLSIREPNEERTVTIRHKEFRVGRGDGKIVELVISDPCVSQEHGRIWQSDNKYWYEDNESTHGSEINEEKILGPTFLAKYDKLKIGETLIEVDDIFIEQIGSPKEEKQHLNKIVFAVAGIILVGIFLLINSKSTKHEPKHDIIAQFNELVIKGELIYIKNETVPFNGTAICSYPNGQQWAKVPFKSGRENGIYEIWYNDGTLMHKAEYVMGIFSGSVKWWDSKGSLALEMTYVDGEQTKLISHSNFSIPIKAIPQIAD